MFQILKIRKDDRAKLDEIDRATAFRVKHAPERAELCLPQLEPKDMTDKMFELGSILRDTRYRRTNVSMGVPVQIPRRRVKAT